MPFQSVMAASLSFTPQSLPDGLETEDGANEKSVRAWRSRWFRAISERFVDNADEACLYTFIS